jgi:mRNA interferase MazF
MAEFIKGDVVVVPFPFSDLSNTKRRPALVITNLTGNDLILCQITSKNVSDSHSILIKEVDFSSGSLNKISNVRPNKLFTADSRIILYKIGRLKEEKISEIIQSIITIIGS